MPDNIPSPESAQNPHTVETVAEQLATFRANNPYSKIEVASAQDGTPSVKLPWGDSSLYFKIPSADASIIAALNNLILPDRFIAIWHIDTRDLEIIFVAFPLQGIYGDIEDRRFMFNFEKHEYVCEYAGSSERLLALAENVVLAGATTSGHRNMYTFKSYVDAERGLNNTAKVPGSKPISFWIRDIPWDQERVVTLARRLNFYMAYYDNSSPIINIQPPKQEASAFPPRERYVIGRFPNSIRSDDISSNLMHYWAASRVGDPFRRFLYSYQIIEYASQFFIEDDVKRSVKNILTTPHLGDDTDGFAIKILELSSGLTMWDGNKIKKLVKEIVDPKLIWREIAKQREYFSTPVVFDGGQTLEAYISDKATEETFCHNWHAAFCDEIRLIRNGLSHGKEHTVSSVIAPTPANFTLIQPWITLISVAAGEVMVRPRASI